MSTSTATPVIRARAHSALYSATALLLAMAVLYLRTVRDLVGDWWRNDDYSYGLLLPFALAYLIYEKRHELKSLPERRSSLGLILVIASQCLNLVGFIGAEFFLQRVSLVFLLAGVILFVFGWVHLREAAFALTLLLLTIPLPALIFNQVAFPLQLFASMISEHVLQAMGIPVLREGNIIQLANMTMSVAEACSGIRSLMSMVTLSIVISYFLPVSWKLRTMFVFSSIPIAICANSVRVAGTGILGQHFGQAAAQGFFHSFSGWLLFVCAFSLLAAESWLVLRIARKKPGVHA